MSDRRRFDDWPRRLDKFVRERRSRPYAYGSNDCCTWVVDLALELTGADIWPGLVRPQSRISAARFILGGGWGDVEGLATRALGPPLASPSFAGRGDAVSFEQAGEKHLAIVVSAVAATPGRDGIIWVPRGVWLNGWRV